MWISRKCAQARLKMCNYVHCKNTVEYATSTYVDFEEVWSGSVENVHLRILFSEQREICKQHQHVWNRGIVLRLGQKRMLRIQGWTVHTINDHIAGDVPAKNTVYTVYIYGSGQPYSNTTWTLWYMTRLY
jgi:hypothetical protein